MVIFKPDWKHGKEPIVGSLLLKTLCPGVDWEFLTGLEIQTKGQGCVLCFLVQAVSWAP